MKTSLSVNNNIIPLNEFTQSYIANVLYGIVRSFGINPETIMVCVDTESLRVYTDKGAIDLSKKDFARQLIESTVKGALSPLKGIFWMQNIVITSNIFEASHKYSQSNENYGFRKQYSSAVSQQ